MAAVLDSVVFERVDCTRAGWRLRRRRPSAIMATVSVRVWIALAGYAGERNHGYITDLLLLGWLIAVTQYCTTLEHV